MAGKNVLILCSDEHARSDAWMLWAHLSSQTPALDRLAARGTRFTRAYTPSPICVPATRLPGNGNCMCMKTAAGRRPSLITVRRKAGCIVVRAAGHAVVSVGKLHFRCWRRRQRLQRRDRADASGERRQGLAAGPVARPAARVSGLLRKWLGISDRATAATRTTIATSPPGPAGGCNDVRRNTDGRAMGAVRLLRQSALSADCAQGPSTISTKASKSRSRLRPDLLLPGTSPRGPAKWRNSGTTTAISMTRPAASPGGATTDCAVFSTTTSARSWTALEASDAARDTVVLYISDHGEMLGNHGLWAKSVMYEDAVGIPHDHGRSGGPGGPSTQRLSRWSTSRQRLKTQSSWRRLRTTGAWQGRSLLSSFWMIPEPERPILSEYHDGGSPTGFFMIRQGRWKYVCYTGGYPPQMFNLDTDPHELDDLGEDARFASERATASQAASPIFSIPKRSISGHSGDQKAVMERYGGADAVRSMPSFNHTPDRFIT